MDNQEIQKKNLNGLLVFLLVIVSLLLIGCGVYIIYDKAFDKDTVVESGEKNSSSTVENGNQNVEETEKVSNDTDFNDKISKKIYVLELIDSLNNNSVYRNYDIYSRSVTNSDISLDDKLFNVLENLYIEYSGKSSVTTNYDFGAAGSNGVEFTQLDVALVEQELKNLYGHGIDSSLHKDMGKCPMFIYDSVNKKYYASAQCGGASSYVVDTYINKITTKGNYVYAYVSLGVVSYDGSNIIYTDYERTKIYDSKNNTSSSDVINKDNYKQFSEYKYTFAKDRDNYYFNSIEKIS